MHRARRDVIIKGKEDSYAGGGEEDCRDCCLRVTTQRDTKAYVNARREACGREEGSDTQWRLVHGDIRRAPGGPLITNERRTQ